MPMPNIDDGLKLIRSRGDLKNWSSEDIKKAISRSIKDDCFAYTVDEGGDLTGLCFGYWRSDSEMHIQYIVGSLQHFVCYLHDRFPNCKSLTMYRRGKFKTLTADKLWIKTLQEQRKVPTKY